MRSDTGQEENSWRREWRSNGAFKCHHKAQLLLLHGTQRNPRVTEQPTCRSFHGDEKRGPTLHATAWCRAHWAGMEQTWQTFRKVAQRPEQTMNELAPSSDLIPTTGWNLLGVFVLGDRANNFFTSQPMTSTLLKQNEQLWERNTKFT